MSPEYQRWNQVPEELRAQLKQLAAASISRLINEGFSFIVNGHGIKIEHDLTLLSDTQRADARKQNSSRHVMLPLRGSSPKKVENHPIFNTAQETPSFKTGHNVKPRNPWH